MSEFFKCQICGKKTERRAAKQKYCPDCAKHANKLRTKARDEAAAELRREAKLQALPPAPKEEKPARLTDHRSLKGKSLARVDAEAKAFGLSYGQYTAAVASGSIDQLLKKKGIDNPRKILSKIKVK